MLKAEDGIRDGHVTGVQTCALPICGITTRNRSRRRRDTDPMTDRTYSARPGFWARRRLRKQAEHEAQQQADTTTDDTKKNEVKEDRKSTRLNSSHVAISYAVFCLKKKNRQYGGTVCYGGKEGMCPGQ